VDAGPRIHRLQLWIGIAVLVGVAAGLVVAGLHLLIHTLVWRPLSLRSDAWVAFLPLAGLLVTAGILRVSRDPSRETTEAYVTTFHRPEGRMPLRRVPGRLLASISTIALGGSLGLEGPSILAGSSIGDAFERRFSALIRDEQAKVLLVAGAAAGIAAIFKAPLTGIVFALEVPYRDELARRALIPAIFAAAASYLVFVALVGTQPFFPLGSAPLSYADLLASAGVGIACGLGARVFVAVFRSFGRVGAKLPPLLRAVAGGLILAGIGLVSIRLYDLPLALGPGYNGMLLAARGQLSAYLLVTLFLLKIVSTSTTAAAGGVGGLFFPSAMLGAALGGAIGHFVPGPASLFAVVGIASFLGAAYKVPLAGVTFVAETTGTPAYIIPGLVAAAISYLVSGAGSLSEHQRARATA
jgi:CIC family chloride channel protein